MTPPHVMPTPVPWFRSTFIAAILAIVLAAGVRAQTTITWSAGTIPQTNYTASEALLINGAGNLDFSATTINSAGTINWNAGTLRSGNGGGIVVASGATFNDNGGGTISPALGGSATFTNNGSFHKLSSAATTISTSFDNNNSVLVSAGTLTLNGGGSAGAASTFNVDPGATANFSGGTFAAAGGASFVGSGNIGLTGATLNIPNGTATFSNLQFTSGTLGGAGGATVAGFVQTGGATTINALTITGASLWSGGNMNGAGTLTITSGGSLSITTATHDFNQRTIANSGSLTWSGGDLRTGNGGSVTNTGTFTDSAASNTTAAFIGNAFGGTVGGFANNGTYTKNANGNGTAGTTTMAMPFTNAGTVNVNAGTLAFNAGGTNNAGAKINVASGAGLNFTAGTFNVGSAADIVDAGGTYTVSGANVTVAAGTNTLPNLTVSGGSIGFTSGGLTLTSLTVNGGTLGSGTFSTGSLALSNGSITSGALTLTGTGSTWTAGNMNGSGSLTVNAGASLAINGSTHDFNQHAFANSGTITWTGGDLRTGNGGAVTNNGTITDAAATSTTAAFFGNAFGGTVGGFANNGTYTKNANGNGTAGTTTIAMPFTNAATGVVNVNAGTLTFASGGSSAAGGKINVANNAVLNFSGGTFNIASATDIVDAGGSYSVSGANVTVAAGTKALPTLNLSGGSLAFTSGGLNLTTLNVSGGSLDGGTYSAGTLTITGGTITSAALTLTGAGSTWNGGNMNGAGSLTLQSGGALALNGTGVHDFQSRAIVNHGAITWSGGQLRTGSGGSITNNGMFADTASDQINNAFGGTPGGFTNAGTYAKNAPGTSTVFLNFANTGTVNVNSGTLALSGGGTNASGAKINVASGAGLVFGGGAFTVASAADIVDAGGTYTVAGGSLTVTSGSTTLPNFTASAGSVGFANGGLTTPTLTVNGGTLSAGDFTATTLALSSGSIATTGNVSLSGANSTWTAGNMNGGGTLTLQSGAGLAITTGNVHDFQARTITNNGTVAWTGGELRTGSGGSIINRGTFTDSASDSINNAFGGTVGSFSNSGTYTKTAAGTTTMSLPLMNSGTVNVNAGTLLLNAGGDTTSSGHFNLASGTTLNFAGGTYTLADATALAGNGTISLTGGTLAVGSGNVTLPNLAITGGTLAPAGNVTVNNFSLTNGNIAGTGGLTIAGPMTWTSGTMNGGGTTTIGSGVTFTISDAPNNVRDFSGHALVNQGTINWNSAYLRSGNGGSFTNAAGANFNDFNSAGYTINAAYGGAFTFINNGTYTRNATGTTYFDAAFNNNGTVALQQGNIELRAGGTLGATGTINAAAGTNVFFRTDYNTVNGSSLLGAGTYWVTAGTFNVSGALSTSTFNQQGGTLAGINSLVGTINWTGGNWNASAPAAGSPLASTTVAAGAVLNLSHANDSFRDFNLRDVTNNGTVNWNSAYIRGGNGSTFTNAAGATFNDLNAGNYTINNPFGGTFTFINNGTYTRNASGTTFVDTTFDNNGTISVQQGDLQFRSGGTLGASGTINAGAGTNVYFTTSYNVVNGSSLTGAGTYWLTGGTLSATGTLAVSTFNQIGGTLAGANSISGTFNWNGGNWNAPAPAAGSPLASTTIAGGAILNLGSNDSFRDFNQRDVTNNGTVNWNSSYIRGGNGSTFTNAAGATFNDRNAGNYTINNPFGGTFTFINNGTYTRNAGGTTFVDTTFNNNGTLNVQQGDLQFRAGGSMSSGATMTVAAGSNVTFTSGFTVANGASFGGAGIYTLTGGTFDVTGTMTVSTFNQTGGTLVGSHVLNGLINWTGGDWNAPATGPSTTIGTGATLNLGGGNTKDFARRAISNHGTVNWNLGYFRGGLGSTFTNESGATFNDFNPSGYTIHNPFGGTFVFTNNGTYNRNAVNSTSYIDTTFDNNGVVNVAAGDLQFRSGGTMATTGSIAAAAGTNVYFTSGYTINNGASLTGAGTFWLTGGTLTLTGTIGVGTFNQTGGSLASTAATINGIFNWSAGDWNAAAAGVTTTIASGASLNLNTGNNKDLNFRTILNQGTTTWNQGYIRGGLGSTFTNAAGGTFNDQNVSGYTVHNPFGGSFVFTNDGTYNRNVGGVTYFDTTFDNNGTINLQLGEMDIRGGGTMGATSVVNASTGATLAITSTYTIADGAKFAGAGNFIQTGGTLTLNGNLKASAFNWSAGNWNASAAATTTIDATTVLNLISGNDKNFDFRSITNNGVVNWQQGYLRAGHGSVFTNAAGATFNDSQGVSYSVHNPFGGTFTFVNDGTYVRTGGNSTLFDTTFNNNGTINLQQGDFQVRAGGTMSASSVVNAASGTSFNFANDYTLMAGAQLLGAGTFVQTGGTLAFTSLRATAFNWSSGNWNGSGTSVIEAGTVLNMISGNDKNFDARNITNLGVVNWQQGYLRAGHGSVFTNAAGATFNDSQGVSYSVHNPFGGTFTFVNDGTYVRTGGNATLFDTTFDNNGTLNLQQGEFHLRAGGTMSAASVVNAAAGTHLYFTNDYTLANGAQLLGAGNFAQTGGTLNFTNLKATSFDWTGGNWNGAGTSTIATGTVVNFNSGNDKNFDARTVVNNGTVNWTAGYLRSGNGGSFTNAAGATFNDLNAPGYTINNPFGGTFTFTNNGNYNKSTTGTTRIDVPATNGGNLNILGGTLIFGTTFTNTGNLTLANGAATHFANAVAFGTGQLTGTGTLNTSSLTAGGLVSPGTPAGTLGVTGNLTLLATSTVLIELGGPTPGTDFDLLSVGGSAALAGNLSVRFLNGYQSSIAPGATFTVVNSTGLTGAFANVANGQQLFTADGAGLFQVNYGPGSVFAANSVVLSNFVAVPEPSTWALMVTGACVVALQLRRRRR